MPSTHYSAFDRGFDLGHVDVPPIRSPVLSRTLVSGPSRRSPLKMIVAVAAVVIMISTALAVLAPTVLPKLHSPADDQPARTEAGERTITYEISHIGESYLKNMNYVYQGNRTATEGLNTWWPARIAWGEYPVRNAYPFVTAYPVLSGLTTPDIDPGFGLQTMARMSIEAKNLETMGTAKGHDPIFIPVLNPSSPGGGNVTLQWRSDIANQQEIADLKSGTHFARTYYGAPRIVLNDDGYWNELYGHMTFDRDAAKTYLGLPGTDDLMDEFTTANAGNAIGDAWMADWLTEGGTGGMYDIFPAYEIALDIRQFVLTLDPASTPDLLNIRIWSVSWGNDALLMRYFEVSKLSPSVLVYFEDMYYNATIGLTTANVTTSYYMQYAVVAWADQTTGMGSWMFEPQHMDYIGSATLPVPPGAWVSRFDPYDPEHTDYTRLSLLPGTSHYGQQVSYWVTPMQWQLGARESLTIKVPTRAMAGFEPYVGTGGPLTDKLTAAKIAEINTHVYWGEAVLGNCIPDPEMKSNYSHATKTITLTGPTSFARNPNPDNPLINYTGVPELLFDVTNVSTYDVKVLPVGGPYNAGVAYKVNITAKNFTGVPTRNSGSLTLSSNLGDAVFGSTTLTFANRNYTETTVTFGSPSSNAYVNATDTWFMLDVDGKAGPLVIGPMIPEFGLLVIPATAAVLMFAIARRRRGKPA